MPSETVNFTLNGTSVGSAITNASGVATLSNVSLAGINAGSYPTGVGASFPGDGSFDPSSGSNSLTVSKADQSINVTTHAPASAVYNTGFSVAATGGASGNAVTFSSSGACSNTGANFTMTSGTGTCAVKYDQAGTANYNPAPQVTESVTAQKANQTITVNVHAPASATYNDSFGVSASAPAGAVTFSSAGSCSNTGATFTMTSGSGACTVKYDQAGDANYNAAPQVTETVNAVEGRPDDQRDHARSGERGLQLELLGRGHRGRRRRELLQRGRPARTPAPASRSRAAAAPAPSSTTSPAARTTTPPRR